VEMACAHRETQERQQPRMIPATILTRSLPERALTRWFSTGDCIAV
jgi:hypothetical protein